MILQSGLSTYDYSKLASAKGWGAGWPNCGSGPTVTVTLAKSKTKIYNLHTKIARLVELVGNEIEKRGYAFVPGWCWGGECRAISGTKTPSNHSWFLAVDINAPKNPYTSTGSHDIPDWAFALWRAYGFGVGADYSGSKKDWMHVEFMGTPNDAALMTALAERNFGKAVAAVIAEATAITKAAVPTEEDDDDMARSTFFFRYLDGRVFETDGLTMRVIPDMNTLGIRLWILRKMGLIPKIWDGKDFVEFTSVDQAATAEAQQNPYIFGYDDTAGRTA